VIRFRDLSSVADEVRGTIDVDGEPFEMWFRVSGATAIDSPEAFTVAAVPVAMARGLAVEAPGPLSGEFARGLAAWQTVLATWYPDRLAPVEVRARERRPKKAASGVASFFTGGVDSFFTALRHLPRLDALVFVHGFDVPLEELPDLRREVSAGLRTAAEELGKPLVEVETNLHDFSDRFESPWGTTFHGAALAAVAHVLSPSFREVLIGGTHTYADLFPWGSHPVADPLLSSDRVRLVHDGADADRVEKTIAVAGSDVALRHLRVCWENRDGTYNCGQCRKCLRTQIALRIAGKLEACSTLPDRIDLDEVRSMPLGDVNTIARHAELVHHLRALGTEPELLAACEDDLRRWDPSSTRWGTRDWTSVLPLVWERPLGAAAAPRP
jgi:hypothetical protein